MPLCISYHAFLHFAASTTVIGHPAASGVGVPEQFFASPWPLACCDWLWPTVTGYSTTQISQPPAFLALALEPRKQKPERPWLTVIVESATNKVLMCPICPPPPDSTTEFAAWPRIPNKPPYATNDLPENRDLISHHLPHLRRLTTTTDAFGDPRLVYCCCPHESRPENQVAGVCNHPQGQPGPPPFGIMMEQQQQEPHAGPSSEGREDPSSQRYVSLCWGSHRSCAPSWWPA